MQYAPRGLLKKWYFITIRDLCRGSRVYTSSSSVGGTWGGCDILILLCYTNYNDGIVLFYAQENGAESAWVKRDDASSWFYNSAGWERK